MSAGRQVLSRALIAALLVAGAPALADGIRFLAPRPEDVISGPTRVALGRIRDGKAVSRVEVYERGGLVGVAKPPDLSFEWKAPPRPEGVLLLAIAFDGEGQILDRASVRTRSPGSIGHVDVARVQLYPVVTARDGSFVKSLSRGDFVVRDEGGEAPFELLSDRELPVQVALLIDTSGSMRGRLPWILSDIAWFVNQLGEKDLVAVDAFNQGRRRLVDWTQDFERVGDAIRDLGGSGGTAMHDALFEVLGELGARPGRKIVVVFSDGRDEGSVMSLERVVDEARRADVLVYAVQREEPFEKRRDLRTLTDETGGQTWTLEPGESLRDVFGQLVEHLRSQYVISYEPPQAAPGVRRVQVRVKGPYEVRCRRSYEHR